MRNRRGFSPEINLTPLLDVLFSVLFIVIITGSKGVQSSQTKNDELVRENAQLTSELEISRHELDSYELYASDAVIITVTNGKIGEDFYLYIYQGIDQTEKEKIKLSKDRTEYIKTRIDNVINDIVLQNENQPIYIVFYVDNNNIHRPEYNAVIAAFEALEHENKEVFFKQIK